MNRAFNLLYGCLILLGLLAWESAWAWNGAGHRLVAHIAWANISPEVRQTCIRLLRQHPDYAHWVERAGESALTANNRLLVLAEASTWADDIRRDPRFSHQDGEPARLPGFPDMEKHSRWHYSEADDTEHDDHLYAALPRLYALLKDSRQTANSRAYALVWLLHLVGDAHQPLHNGIRPDRGGNEFSVLIFDGDSNRNTNLHAFWDDLPGKSNLRGTALMHMTDALLASEHISLVESRPDFARWRMDNFRVSRQFAYPPNEQTVLSTTFIRRSQTVANRQLVIAGKRLALMLESALGAESGAESRVEKRTPFHVERRPEH